MAVGLVVYSVAHWLMQVEVKVIRIFCIATLTIDQHRFTSWQTTGKNDAWSSAIIAAYDELAPSQAALQLV